MRLMSRAALGLAATLFAAPALSAQTSFGVAVGAAVPVGSTADGVKMGYNATVALGIKPPLSPVGARIEGAFNSFEGEVANSGTTRIMAGIVNATLGGVGTPIPMGYLIGGLGMYNSSVSGLPAGATKPESTTKLGFNIGAGFKFPVPGLSPYLEARLHVVTTEGSSTKFVPITFGITF